MKTLITVFLALGISLAVGQSLPFSSTSSSSSSSSTAQFYNDGGSYGAALQVEVPTFVSTQTDGGPALVIGGGSTTPGSKICTNTACTHSIKWDGYEWATDDALLVTAAINVASGTGFNHGTGVNTSHIVMTGKGNDYASFDSTASPGAANAGTFPMGKAAIAAAAGSVVITTSAVRALSSVFITPIDVDTTCLLYKVTSADGTFTVTTYSAAGIAANCNATWKFNWVVFGKSQYE